MLRYEVFEEYSGMRHRCKEDWENFQQMLEKIVGM